MEISKILDLADHLLAGQETNNPETQKEIIQIRTEIKGLMHLNEMGYSIAVELGLQNITSHINELVLRIIDENPCESPSTEDLSHEDK